MADGLFALAIGWCLFFLPTLIIGYEDNDIYPFEIIMLTGFSVTVAAAFFSMPQAVGSFMHPLFNMSMFGLDSMDSIAIIGFALTGMFSYGAIYCKFRGLTAIRRLLTQFRLLRPPKQVDFNLAELNIKDLHIESNVRTVEGNAVKLERNHKNPNEADLHLPEGTYASNILRLNNAIILKLLSPNFDTSRRNGLQWRVLLLGKDESGQPWLSELPPNYRKKSIEECERYIMMTAKQDKVVAT